MKKKVMGPTQHDLETEGLPSASGFDAEFRCPGKRALCAKLPKEEDTAVQARGIRIHGAMESWNLEKLNDSDKRTAQRMMYGESQLVHEYNFEGSEVTFEERVWDTDSAFNKLWSGRVDRYDWQPDSKRLLVIDNKSGWVTPPEITRNWQVRSEGAVLSDLFHAKETVVALIHPHHPDSLHESQVYTRSEMLDLLDTVRANVVNIQRPNARRIPGPIQCEWCEAKRICPEFQKAAATLAEAIDDEIADEGFTAILKRTKKERGEHVGWIKLVMKSFQFVLDQYTELVQREGEDAIQGWRLARKLNRSVTDEEKALAIIEHNFGQEVLDACVKFNIVALEEKLAEKRGMREAKLMVRTVLGALVKYTPSKYFLEEARSL